MESQINFHPEAVIPPVLTYKMLEFIKSMNFLSSKEFKNDISLKITDPVSIDKFLYKPTKCQEELHDQLVQLIKIFDRRLHHTDIIKIKCRPARATEIWIDLNHFILLYNKDDPTELIIYNLTINEKEFKNLQEQINSGKGIRKIYDY